MEAVKILYRRPKEIEYMYDIAVPYGGILFLNAQLGYLSFLVIVATGDGNEVVGKSRTF